jgi:ABC-type sulfate transport system permease component
VLAFLDGNEFYESVYSTGIWWLVTLAVICPLLVVGGIVILVWILGELRDYFDVLRDDRTEGSYLVEASLALLCVVLLVAVASYVAYFWRQPHW